MPAEHLMTSDAVEYRELTEWPGYRVGSDGSVWSRKRSNENKGGEWVRMRPSVFAGKKYLRAHLLRDGRKFGVRVHRLVLLAFVGPCPPGCVACHNDGDPTNNRPENLRWDTMKENHADRTRHGRTPCRLTREQVVEIIRLLAEGHSQASIARRFGVGHASIHAIAIGKNWQHIPGPRHFVRGPCRGSRVKTAKLSGADIADILKLAAAGHTAYALGRRFGVAPASISYHIKHLRD